MRVRTKAPLIKVDQADGLELEGSVFFFQFKDSDDLKSLVENPKVVGKDGTTQEQEADQYSGLFRELWFGYLVAWEGINDEADVTVEFSDNNKQALWDYDRSLCASVISEAMNIMAKRRDLVEKN